MDTSFPSALRVMQVVDAAQESAHASAPVTIDPLVNA
jgi:hypothetical protein